MWRGRWRYRYYTGDALQILLCCLQTKVQQIMAMPPADLGKSQQQLMVNRAKNRRSHRSQTCQTMAASVTTR